MKHLTNVFECELELLLLLFVLPSIGYLLGFLYKIVHVCA